MDYDIQQQDIDKQADDDLLNEVIQATKQQQVQAKAAQGVIQQQQPMMPQSQNGFAKTSENAS